MTLSQVNAFSLMMEPSEGGDPLERVFNICDTDGDGLVSREELEVILQEIGVEFNDINDFMGGLQSQEFITYQLFVDAIEKFRAHENSSSLIQSVNSRGSPRSFANSAAGGVSSLQLHFIL